MLLLIWGRKRNLLVDQTTTDKVLRFFTELLVDVINSVDVLTINIELSYLTCYSVYWTLSVDKQLRI